MEEIVTRDGQKKTVLSHYNIYGKNYYIISSTEVYTTSRSGNFERFDFTSDSENDDKMLARTKFLFREMLKPAKSLDVKDNEIDER